MPMKLNHRKDIQVLRGLAVLAVVLFHANENYFPLGYLGVDVFFVISGFVVTPLILRIFAKSANEFGGGLLTNLSSFWKRRFYRLAPAMLFALSLSAVFMFVLASPTSFKIYGNQFLATILFAGNYGVFKNSGDYFNNLGNPLIHTWSLSVEEQIYFLLPMIMVLLLGKNRNTKIRFAKIMSVITLASLILFIYPSILQPIYEKIGISDPYHLFFYSPVHRVWQFTIGGLGYLLVNNNKFFERKRINAIHQIISLSFIWFIFGFLSIESRYASILVSFTTLLVICFRSLDSVLTLLKFPFEWLGDRSYSIYLFHMPFIFIAKSSPYFSNSSFNEFFILLAVALSITIGAFTYSKVWKIE